MKHIKLLSFLGLFIFKVNSLSAQVNIASDKRTTSYLDSFRLKYTDGMLKENFKNVLGYYSESVRLMPEFQKTILGRPNTKLYYDAFFTRYNVQSYSRTRIEILDLDSMVIELGYLDMTIVSEKHSRNMS